MIIFFILIIFLILLLFLKVKLNIFIEVKNTRSFIEIKSLWIDFKRKGKFELKRKDKENLNFERGKYKQRKKTSKIFKWFFKNIQYDEVKIFERIGAFDLFTTVLALPVVSLITTVPLNYLNINHKYFNYKIVADYNNLVFYLSIKAKASFRIFDLIRCIIKEKIA